MISEGIVLTNFVPAVAVKRRERALFVVIGRKGYVDGQGKFIIKIHGSTVVVYEKLPSD